MESCEAERTPSVELHDSTRQSGHASAWSRRIGFSLSFVAAANDLHADHPQQPGTNLRAGVLVSERMGARMSKLGWVVSLGLMVSLVGCGDDAAPPPPSDGGGRDAFTMDSSCVVCDPPTGCTFEGGDGCTSCGTLVCMDGAPPFDAGTDADPFDAMSTFFDACATPLCPPAPTGCRYEGATECECGELVCTCGSAECTSSQVCRFDSGCAGTGTCVARPTVCDDVVDPVCGCNGATYNNACDAESSGIAVGTTGECPDTMDCRDASCPIGSRCVGCDDGATFRFSCLPNDVDCGG